MLRPQLEGLDGKSSEPVEGLVNSSDATCHMEAILRSATGLIGLVKVAKEAMFAPGARCSSGDTALLKVDGTMHVGKVQDANVSGRDFSRVEMWRPVGQNMFEPLKGASPTPDVHSGCMCAYCSGGWPNCSGSVDLLAGVKKRQLTFPIPTHLSTHRPTPCPQG